MDYMEKINELRAKKSKILSDAEAKGNFRRLVPDDEIGWTTPWEVVTSHPRHREIP